MGPKFLLVILLVLVLVTSYKSVDAAVEDPQQSVIIYNFRTEATSLIDFNHVDITDARITLTGKFYKHPYLPKATNDDGVFESYIFGGKMEWVYTEDIISNTCEVTKFTASGTEDLDTGDGAFITVETTKGSYMFALTKQVDVTGKENIEVSDQPNCIDHKIQGQPYGWRLLGVYFTSPKALQDSKNIKDSISVVKETPCNDCIIRDVIGTEWDIHLPSLDETADTDVPDLGVVPTKDDDIPVSGTHADDDITVPSDNIVIPNKNPTERFPTIKIQRLAEIDNIGLSKNAGQINMNIEDLERKLNSMDDDAQLANVDLQNTLQKQQQTLEMLSNISKMMQKVTKSIIENIGA